jgi:hypothetical protein
MRTKQAAFWPKLSRPSLLSRFFFVFKFLLKLFLQTFVNWGRCYKTGLLICTAKQNTLLVHVIVRSDF